MNQNYKENQLNNKLNNRFTICNLNTNEKFEINIKYNNSEEKNLKETESNKNETNDESEDIFIVIDTKREKQKHPRNLLGKKHTCNSKDNLIRKIKVHFFKFLVNLCNDFISKEVNNIHRINLKYINSEIAKDVTIELNNILKDLLVKDVLSLPINKKYKNVHKYINKETIEILLKEYPKLGELFNQKIISIYDLFVDKNKKEKLQYFGIKKAIPLYDLVNQDEKFLKIGSKYIKLILNISNDLFSKFPPNLKRNSQKKKNLLIYFRNIQMKNNINS